MEEERKPKKPANKKEARMYALRDKLGPITDKQIQYMKDRMPKYVTFKYSKHVCTECGHAWKDNKVHTQILKGATCPKCKTELEYKNWTGHLREAKAMSIITVRKGYQVIRSLECEKYYSKSWIKRVSVSEVTQTWIAPDGTTSFMKLPMKGMYGNQGWNTSRELAFRGDVNMDITPHWYYPRQRVIPILKRNGWKTRGHYVSPQYMAKALLEDNFAETLIKSKQYKLFQWWVYAWRNREDYQPQIRIALRHNFIVTNAESFKDHIDSLRELNMDDRNPEYICPDNFHEFKMEINQRVILKNQREEEKRDRDLRAEEVRKRKLTEHIKKTRYKKVAKLKGVIKQGDITVEPFLSDKQVKKEGEYLNHCIFSNKYHLKEFSIILSVRVKGVITETAEYDFKRKKVVQAYGYDSKPTKYNKKIISLVNKNSKLINKVLSA